MLKVENLIAGYGGAPVLDGVAIEVGAGEAVSIVGANGAGKSTLVKSICGLLVPIDGSVYLDNFDITNVPPHKRPGYGVSVVLENRNLFADLTVLDNLKLAISCGHRDRSNAQHFSLNDVFEMFPVVRDRQSSRVSLLSGGQQQMVAIARALLLQPRLFLLDELTTGLSPLVVREILEVLKKLKSDGLSLLLVEQSLAVAAEVTDRTYVMSLGKIVRTINRDEWLAVLNDPELMSRYLHG
jgi:ABC-type branched-subunit amino acid transport system ATPase component